MTSLRSQVVFITLSRTVLNTAHRMIYPFLAVFGRGLGVDFATLSKIVSLRSLFGATAPFLSSTADNRGRKAGMLLGFTLFSGSTLLVVLWPSYTAFVLVLFLTLAGKYVFDPAMQAYLGDRIPYQRRGQILAITELSWSLSFIAGIPLVGLLIVRGGWSAPFPLFTALGLLALLGLFTLLPADPEPLQNRPSLWRNLWQVLSHPPALAGLSLSLFASAGNEVVNLIFGVWMEDSFGLKIAALGAASAVIGLSELGGEALSSLLTDRLGKPLAVWGGLVLNCLAAVALAFAGSSLVGALTGLFFFYITFEFTLVSTIPLMTEIRPATRATLMSLNVAGHSFGRALGAALAGQIYQGSILGSSLAAVALNLLALLALWYLRKTVRQ